MAIYFKKEKVSEIFAEHGGAAKNTGSVEGQVALFTFRIEQLSLHLKTCLYKSTFGSRRKKKTFANLPYVQGYSKISCAH